MKTRRTTDTPLCGRETRRCVCGSETEGHHRKDHQEGPGACTLCDCQQFRPRPCQKHCLIGRTACKLHGGPSRRGTLNPLFGVRDPLSVALPPGLAKRYQASLDDPQLLSLRKQIALTEARVLELAERLKDREGAPKGAQKTWTAIKAAMQSGDPAALRAALDAHEQALDYGTVELETWSELRKERELLRKQKESENDVLLKEQYVISIERALALTAAMQMIFVKALDTHVQNPTERQAIRSYVAAQYPRLVSGRGRPTAEPGPVRRDGVADDPAPAVGD